MFHYRKSKKKVENQQFSHSNKKGMLLLKQIYQEFVTPEAAHKSTVTDWGQFTQTTFKHKPAAQGAGSSPCLLLTPTNVLVLMLLQD